MRKKCNFKSNPYLNLISKGDWSDKSECHCRTTNGTLLSNKSGSIKERNQRNSEIGTGSDQSSGRSWLVQPIKELSSVAGLCAGRGCALLRQLANCPIVTNSVNCVMFRWARGTYSSCSDRRWICNTRSRSWRSRCEHSDSGLLGIWKSCGFYCCGLRETCTTVSVTNST